MVLLDQQKHCRFVNWRILSCLGLFELGLELVVLTLGNLCSFRKKGCQGPHDEERRGEKEKSKTRLGTCLNFL